ncbi:MAG: hypothetical protein P4L57_07790 [Rhizomicrobium sp.]|nr:hypothetical protein [Rhizomicrobium sp.]
MIGRWLAVAVCAALLGGCLPVTSKTPVGTTTGLSADKALYGSWKGHSPDDAKAKDGFVHFLAAKDGSMTAVLVMADGGSDNGWTVFGVRTAALGKNHILNAVMTFDKDAPAEGGLKNATIPLLYVLKGKTLTLYLLDEAKVKAAIKAGTLKGTIEPGASGDAVISEDAAALDAFFAKAEAVALFKPMLVLKKVE